MGRSNAPCYGRIASKRGSVQNKMSDSSDSWDRKLNAALAAEEASVEHEGRMLMCSQKYEKDQAKLEKSKQIKGTLRSSNNVSKIATIVVPLSKSSSSKSHANSSNSNSSMSRNPVPQSVD